MSVHFARKHDPEKQKKCPHCEFQTGNAGCEEFREPKKLGIVLGNKVHTTKYKVTKTFQF